MTTNYFPLIGRAKSQSAARSRCHFFANKEAATADYIQGEAVEEEANIAATAVSA